MLLSLTPILFLVGMLAGAVQLFGADASYGPNQIALVIATGLTGLVGLYRGLRWDDIQEGLVAGIRIGMSPILILLAVGALIGSWIFSRHRSRHDLPRGCSTQSELFLCG